MAAFSNAPSPETPTFTLHSVKDSDVLLTLQTATESEETLEPGKQRPDGYTLYAHSVVLRKHSKFFETLFSERWRGIDAKVEKASSLEETGVTLTGCRDVGHQAYVSVLEYM